MKMATSIKKRDLNDKQPSVRDDENISSSSDGENMEEDDSDSPVEAEVNVDFEARNPEDGDFHGIRKLLQQLFVKANIDLGELTDTIISQNYVGSVIRQCSSDDDDEDDDVMDVDDIFGLISVINITERKNLECVKQLKSMLLTKCKENCATTVGPLTDLFESSQHQVGLLISERFINIPAQIALPSFQSLWKECERACAKQMAYQFSHYLMLCKTYRVAAVSGKKPSSNVIFANEEEEFFADASSQQFSYSVAHERDTVVDGEWDTDDTEMEPRRTVLVVPADSLPPVMHRLQQVLALPPPAAC